MSVIKIQLTPTWQLVANNDAVALVNLTKGVGYLSNELVTLYPSWGEQPARVAVRRAAKMDKLTAVERGLVESFCGEDEAADAHIHLRVPMAKKSSYVKKAKSEGKTLSDWIISRCDEGFR